MEGKYTNTLTHIYFFKKTLARWGKCGMLSNFLGIFFLNCSRLCVPCNPRSSISKTITLCLLLSPPLLSFVCHGCIPSQRVLQLIPFNFTASQFAPAGPRHQKKKKKNPAKYGYKISRPQSHSQKTSSGFYKKLLWDWINILFLFLLRGKCDLWNSNKVKSVHSRGLICCTYAHKNHHLLQQTIYLPFIPSTVHLDRGEGKQFWLRPIYLHSASPRISQTQFHLHFTPQLECFFSKHCAISIRSDTLRKSTFCTEAKCEVLNAWRVKCMGTETEKESFHPSIIC